MRGAEGIPKCDAASITTAAGVSAEKPWIGSDLVSRIPIVLIILQPPMAVPIPMVLCVSLSDVYLSFS